MSDPVRPVTKAERDEFRRLALDSQRKGHTTVHVGTRSMLWFLDAVDAAEAKTETLRATLLRIADGLDSEPSLEVQVIADRLRDAAGKAAA